MLEETSLLPLKEKPCYRGRLSILGGIQIARIELFVNLHPKLER